MESKQRESTLIAIVPLYYSAIIKIGTSINVCGCACFRDSLIWVLVFIPADKKCHNHPAYFKYEISM